MMKITLKDSTKKRANYLRDEIVAMIEAGEFIPDTCYLFYSYNNNVGPCGCAIAATGFLALDKDIQSLDDGRGPYFPGNIKYLAESKGLATADEITALESGYEDEECRSVSRSNEFYKLGQYLRQFHPYV